jgi:hypothetical protein
MLAVQAQSYRFAVCHGIGKTVPGTGEVARFPVETLGTHKDGIGGSRTNLFKFFLKRPIWHMDPGMANRTISTPLPARVASCQPGFPTVSVADPLLGQYGRNHH